MMQKSSHISLMLYEGPFLQQTWHCVCFVFMLLTPKVATAETYFLHYDISVKTLCTTLELSLH